MHTCRLTSLRAFPIRPFDLWQLLSGGSAEVFGTELAPGRQHVLGSCKLAVFTWTGCNIELGGDVAHVYVAEASAMHSYVNAHAVLHALGAVELRAQVGLVAGAQGGLHGRPGRRRKSSV